MHHTDDPTTFYARLHQDAPIQQIGESSFYAVGSWDLIAEAVSRPDDFSSNLTATMVWHDDGTVSEFPVAGLGDAMHVLATADGPRHRDHRTLVMPSVSPARIRALEPQVRRLVADAWRSGLHDGRIDWVAAIAGRIPMAVVTELLGLRTDALDDLTRWAVATNVLIDGVITPAQLATATAAVAELTAHLSHALTERMAGGGNGSDNSTALSQIADRVTEGRLDHDEAVMILFQLVAAGAESTTTLLSSAVWLLSRHPDTEAELRREPALIPVFVEEALRLETPFRGHFRHVVSDTTLGGTALPAGAHVFLMWGAGNRDPARFDDPAIIDLDPAARRSHLAFGKGLHLCVGAALARLQARIAIEHLLAETPAVRLDADGSRWEEGVLARKLATLPVIVGDV
ncbi:cytochrome P450 [Gordonia sp. 'Campus']|uniref:cytochrome P450 n=1 Tax=Gordonia sp. 'Campus' TaxID=2915824 RepID=UPI001EE3D5A7|nr:cytochrome P450 [Gordonia sp. 'Campus']